MKKKKLIISMSVLVLILAAAIGYHVYTAVPAVDVTEETEEMEKVAPVGPAFNADSAYAFTAAQCAFGPRDMNSEGHERCKEWIIRKFRSYGCEVNTQEADLKGYDGTVLKSTNIIASINPQATTRILICAHWDSRPWADNDPDSLNWRKPILAANDAASGVAVMLELARLLKAEVGVQNAQSGMQKVNGGKQEAEQAGAEKGQSSKFKDQSLGVDFVCFDAEDWGTPQWSNQQDDPNSWALGAQHFAANLPQGYAPRYGILLDMVGGQGAQFYREGMSMQYAPEIVKKVWRAARQAGFGSFFPRQDGGMITDDHIPVNEVAKIPCIDIIPYYPACEQSSFGPTWHTLADDMDHIDRNTLKAVGQTLILVLFTEE